jgi:hypothetical protein
MMLNYFGICSTTSAFLGGRGKVFFEQIKAVSRAINVVMITTFIALFSFNNYKQRTENLLLL